MLRLIDGKLHTEEMLADPKVLSGFGFNPREIAFLAREPWWKLPEIYYAPYMDAFKDEYRPFDAGPRTTSIRSRCTQVLQKDGASPGFLRFFGDAHGSALQSLWHAALLKLRGVPLVPPGGVPHQGRQRDADRHVRGAARRPRPPGLPGHGHRARRHAACACATARPARRRRWTRTGWSARCRWSSCARCRSRPAWPEARPLRGPRLPVLHGVAARVPVAHALLGAGRRQPEHDPERARARAHLAHGRRRRDHARPDRGHRPRLHHARRTRSRPSAGTTPAAPTTSSRRSSSTGRRTRGRWPASRSATRPASSRASGRR